MTCCSFHNEISLAVIMNLTGWLTMVRISVIMLPITDQESDTLPDVT